MNIHDLLTTEEVADLIGTSKEMVRRWARAGRFPGAVQIGKSVTWFIPPEDVESFERRKPGRPRKDE
jgi:excisionase family DNA binding protein